MSVPISDKAVCKDAGPVLCEVSVATESVPLSEKAVGTERGPVVHDVAVGTERVALLEKGVCTEQGPVWLDVAVGSDCAAGMHEKGTATEQGPVFADVAVGPEERVELIEKGVGTESLEVVTSDKGVGTDAIGNGLLLDTARVSSPTRADSASSSVQTKEKGVGTEGLSEVRVFQSHAFSNLNEDAIFALVLWESWILSSLHLCPPILGAISRTSLSSHPF